MILDRPIWTRGWSRSNRRIAIGGGKKMHRLKVVMPFSVDCWSEDQINGGKKIGEMVDREELSNAPMKNSDAIER